MPGFVASADEASELPPDTGGFIASGEEATPIDQSPQPPGMVGSFLKGIENNVPGMPQLASVLENGGPKNYSQNMEASNTSAADARAANPLSYGTGAVLGTVGGGLAEATGLGALGLGAIPTAAIIGGLGATSNTDITEHPGEAAAEAGLGAVTGGVSQALLGQLISKYGAKALSQLGPSEEAINARMVDPEIRELSNMEINKPVNAANEIAGQISGLKYRKLATDDVTSKLAEIFGLRESEPVVGEKSTQLFYRPTKATIDAVQTAMSDPDSLEAKAIDAIQRHVPGANIRGTVNNIAAASQFAPKNSFDWQKMLGAAIVGGGLSAFHNPVAGAAGAVLGGLGQAGYQAYGPQAAGKIVDYAAKPLVQNLAPMLTGKFGKELGQYLTDELMNKKQSD